MEDPEAMDAELAVHAGELADRIEAALPGWVSGAVGRVLTAWNGTVPDEVAREADEAGRRAVLEVGGAVRELLATDVDRQRTTPLALVRDAVRYPTEVLRAAGVPPVQRDRFAEDVFPDDLYGLTPGSFSDLGPDTGEAGLRWGAAKAFVHKARHRR